MLIVDALCAPLTTKVKYGWQALVQRMCPLYLLGWNLSIGRRFRPRQSVSWQTHRFRARPVVVDL